MSTENLTPEVIAALANRLTKDAKTRRSQLEPGTYEVDENVTLHVEGIVRVYEDHAYQPTASIPLKLSLALFLRYSGITGQHAIAGLVRAMQEALAIEALPEEEKKTATEAIRELADLREAEKTVVESLAKLPPQIRKGAVYVDTKVTAVNPEAPTTEQMRAEVNRMAKVSAEEAPLGWQEYVQFFSPRRGQKVLPF